MNVVMVLNYKAPNETISCVESILKHCPSIDHAVVVDNDSQDGSSDVLQRWQAENDLGQVTVLASPRNDGYAGGNNYGMRWALDNLPVQHFWVINNDAYVKDDAFAPLLAELQRAPKTIVGSVILSSQTGRLECYGGGILYPLLGKSKLLGKDITVADIAKLEREPDYIMGCSMAFCASLLSDVGFMDEAYFMYSEEVDWQHQAKRKGVALKVCRESQLYHYGSMSSGGRSAFYHYFRNRAATRFNRKFHGTPFALVSAVLLSGITVLKEFKNPKLAWSGVKGAFKGATMHV